MNFLIIQFLGFIAWILEFISYWAISKKRILFIQIISDIFYAIHYYLLDARIGALVCFICLFREVLFYFAKNKENEKNLCILFIFIYLLIGMMTINNISDLFPILAEMTYCYTLTFKIKWIIVGGIVDSIYWIIYGIVSYSYISIITDVMLIISNTISLLERRKITISNIKKYIKD